LQQATLAVHCSESNLGFLTSVTQRLRISLVERGA
jgi:hypothetical protein